MWSAIFCQLHTLAGSHYNLLFSIQCVKGIKRSENCNFHTFSGS